MSLHLDTCIRLTLHGGRTLDDVPELAGVPCENCGTRTLVASLAELLEASGYAEALAPLARHLGQRDLIERHPERVGDDERNGFRVHTVERCRLARRGDPEPFDLFDDDEGDDEP